MPITKSKAFVTSDNQVFLTREDAQKHEIELILKLCVPDKNGMITPGQATEQLMERRADIVAILSDRKPRTLKVKPAARPRRNAAVNAATQPAS